jgi:catechol 2,3-dioxygenase-like lactoylglutathione lyase family enzyme
MVDRGLTHVALPVSNLNDSIAFYAQYARMQAHKYHMDIVGPPQGAQKRDPQWTQC